MIDITQLGSRLLLFAFRPLMGLSLIVALALLPKPSFASPVDIPELNLSDIPEAIKILGLGSSSRFVSNPYPLGGYSGFEIGFSHEIIDTQDFARLGPTQPPPKDLRLNRLSIGKGVYNNFDIFVHFVPFSRGSQVSEFGGTLKWTPYEARFLPLTFSVLGHSNTINLQDQYNSQSFGLDALTAVSVNNFALYFGAGRVQSRSTFTEEIVNSCVGPGIPVNCVPLDSNNLHKARAYDVHTYVGINIDVRPFF